MTENQNDSILRVKQVQEISGLSRSSIYEYMSQDKFPKQRAIGGRCVGWKSSEVFRWVAERPLVG